MKKKVLFMLSNMVVGGTEKAFLNLVDTMSPEEYEVTLLLLRRWGGFLEAVPDWVKVETIDGYDRLKREIMDPPLPIVKDYLKQGKLWRGAGIAWTHLWFKLTGDRVPYYRFVLRGTQKKWGPYDVAVAFAGPTDIISVYIQECVEAATKVQWIHMDVSKSDFNAKTCRKLYPKFQHIFVVSEEARQALVHVLPEIERLTRTVPNVISARLCRQQAEQGEGFTDDYTGIRIVTLGRLSAEKGQDIIPEVAAELAAKGVDFRWYLVGDGKLRSVIEEKAAALGVTDRVVLLGTKTNPYPYLKDADLYVQTSVHEGFCITLAEAKIFQKPIVTTNFNAVGAQFINEKNGLIVDISVQGITDGIMRMLTDTKLRERCIANVCAEKIGEIPATVSAD